MSVFFAGKNFILFVEKMKHFGALVSAVDIDKLLSRYLFC